MANPVPQHLRAQVSRLLPRKSGTAHNPTRTEGFGQESGHAVISASATRAHHWLSMQSTCESSSWWPAKHWGISSAAMNTQRGSQNQRHTSGQSGQSTIWDGHHRARLTVCQVCGKAGCSAADNRLSNFFLDPWRGRFHTPSSGAGGGGG